MSFDGVIPVWKEPGLTSHDVVAKIRKLAGQKRIGHAGTLDPDVSGVLVICLGQATRLVERLQAQPKTYEADVLFGLSTDTEDAQGNIQVQMSGPEVLERVNQEKWEDVLQTMTGPLEQVPPMMSAVKVDGKKLYEYARNGITVERQPRTIHIYSMNSLGWKQPSDVTDYPIASYRVTCSKGTYVRTLCVEMGIRLGVPARMEHLIRTHSGSFSRAQSFTLEQLRDLKDQGRFTEAMLSIPQALKGWSVGQLYREERARWVKNGGYLLMDEVMITPGEIRQDDEMLLLDDVGEPLGLYLWNHQAAHWKPEMIFQSAASDSGKVVPL